MEDSNNSEKNAEFRLADEGHSVETDRGMETAKQGDPVSSASRYVANLLREALCEMGFSITKINKKALLESIYEGSSTRTSSSSRPEPISVQTEYPEHLVFHPRYYSHRSLRKGGRRKGRR